MRVKRTPAMLGFELKRWRRHTLKLTAAQAAEIIGVTLRAVQEWEQGRRPVPQYAINSLTMFSQQPQGVP